MSALGASTVSGILSICGAGWLDREKNAMGSEPLSGLDGTYRLSVSTAEHY